MDEPRMPALLVEHHRPAFYFRVLETGEVAAGDEIVKVSSCVYQKPKRERIGDQVHQGCCVNL
jgi:MOSC domain-containing protein YiiM